MKKFLQLLGVLFVFLLILPILPLIQSRSDLQAHPEALSKQTTSAVSKPPEEERKVTADKPSAAESKTTSTSSKPAPATPTSDQETVTVFRNGTDEQQTLPMRDYLIGVVLCEMPVEFEAEALKAQAVVAHTYAQYQLARASTLTDSSATHQAYSDKAELKERFGSNYESYYQKVAACVDAVYPQVLTYEKEPILAAFHAISGGRTETASNVWGSEYPYLVAVDSEGDSLCDGYSSAQTVSEKEVKNALTDALPNVKLPAKPADWMRIQKNTPSGYVDTVQIGTESLSGQQIRSLFRLRSADFSIQYQDGNFVFSTDGYGHGVGMSQYGANYYAKQGQSYDEILAHYYPGTTLSK